jgi:hypothetical protein
MKNKKLNVNVSSEVETVVKSLCVEEEQKNNEKRKKIQK